MLRRILKKNQYSRRIKVGREKFNRVTTVGLSQKALVSEPALGTAKKEDSLEQGQSSGKRACPGC